MCKPSIFYECNSCGKKWATASEFKNDFNVKRIQSNVMTYVTYLPEGKRQEIEEKLKKKYGDISGIQFDVNMKPQSIMYECSCGKVLNILYKRIK